MNNKTDKHLEQIDVYKLKNVMSVRTILLPFVTEFKDGEPVYTDKTIPFVVPASEDK